MLSSSSSSASSASSWSAAAKENPKLARPSITLCTCAITTRAAHCHCLQSSRSCIVKLRHLQPPTALSCRGDTRTAAGARGSSAPSPAQHGISAANKESNAPSAVHSHSGAHRHAVGVVDVAAGQGGGLLPLLQRAQAHATLRGGTGVRGNGA